MDSGTLFALKSNLRNYVTESGHNGQTKTVQVRWVHGRSFTESHGLGGSHGNTFGHWASQIGDTFYYYTRS